MSSIICVGDFGSGEKGQYKVSELIKYLIKKYKVTLILGLGDNIYPDGVTSINDPQFTIKFEEPYKNLPNNIQFYHVLGNHDYHGNVRSQINYTNLSERWNLPYNFYCFSKKIGDTMVEFFAIDTNLSNLSANKKKIQEKWVIESLRNSKARWRIVYGHHPWRSSGIHGQKIDKELDSFYSKIVETGKIDFIIAGHDHDQQHIHIPDTPELLISGTGSSFRHTPKIIRSLNKNLLFYSEKIGCLLLQISKKKINLCIYSAIDKTLEYKYTLEK